MSMSEADQTSAKPERVLSIDALRGFDMFWITGGNTVFAALAGLFVSPLPEWLKYQMSHPAWEGFSAWDVIMPLFLFIVGAAMPFAFSRRLEAGQSKGELYLRIARRVIVLWVLGMIAQGHLLDFDLSNLQLFSNTLQAIAVGYLVAGIALIHLSVLGQVVLAVALLVGYWLLMLLVPFPGHTAGVMEEQANLALYIDQVILGRFRDGTSYTWILSGLGFAGTVLMGVFGGHLLRSSWSATMKFVWLIVMGLGSLALGWFWAGGFDQMFGATLVGAWRFPLIKHLFTSSMVLWAAGWCYLLLALFYLLIDMLQFRKWALFFIVIGANPIFAYMIVRFVDFDRIAQRLFGGLAGHIANLGEFGQSLSAALLAVIAYGVLWLLLWYMYRNRTLIRV
jgi:predicted acyltransferase